MAKNDQADRTRSELTYLNINSIDEYLGCLSYAMSKTEITIRENDGQRFSTVTLNRGMSHVLGHIRRGILVQKKRLMVVGNGGSAAIAIHMLMDFVNAVGIRTIDFTSPALLTCMANDYGYENVFAKPIEKFADEGDVLFAISSSGESRNILNACDAAVEKNCTIVTFSGMKAENQLRSRGFINFYVPSTHYGFVEIAHQALLHGILDLLIKTSL